MAIGVATQRFRRVGNYSTDQLLKDLRDLNDEVQALRLGIDGGTITGIRGENGRPGNPGRDGTNGKDGDPGTPGNDGLSAYELWILQGNDGTLDDFLTSLAASVDTDTLQELIDERISAGHNYDNDYGFIDTDFGSITDSATVKEDYGDLNG